MSTNARALRAQNSEAVETATYDGISVHPAKESDIERVCETLAAGLFDDRLVNFMFPDASRRASYLPAFFRPYVDFAWEHGLVFLADGYSGALVVYKPGFASGNPGVELNGELDLRVYEASGPDAPRAAAVMHELTTRHPRNKPHYYGLFMAVRPEQRNTGCATALITRWSTTMDRRFYPGYFEATTLKCAFLLSRSGWRSHSDPFSAAGAPDVFPMWWDMGPQPL